MNVNNQKRVEPLTGNVTSDEFWSTRALSKHSNHYPLNKDILRSNFIYSAKYQPKQAFTYLQPLPEPLPTLRNYQASMRAARFRQLVLDADVDKSEVKTKFSEPLPPIDVTPTEKRTPPSFSGVLSTEPVAKKMHLQEEKRKPRRSPKGSDKKQKDIPLIGLSDISQVISVIRRNQSYNIDFLYLTPLYPKTSPHHHFYKLKVARYSSIDKSYYFTISRRGVIWFCSGNEAEFSDLKEWEQDFLKFKKLREFKFFGQFQMWKPFKQWYTNIRWMKIQQSTTFLKENLFIANPLLCTAILAIRDMCQKISEMTLCSIKKGKIYTLAEFQTVQKAQVNSISKHLEQFHDIVKDIVRNACSSSMLKEGFLPESRKTDTNSESSSNVPPSLKPKKNKRLVCNRLSCFIHFIDYIIVSVLRQLIIDSILKLLNYLVELLNTMPSVPCSRLRRKKSIVVCTGPEFFLNETDEEAEAEISRPLFIVDLFLKYDRFIFQPDYKSFTDGITQIMLNYQETVLAVPNLLPDEYFNSFTQPIVYNCQLEKICGNGPNLFIIFEEDGSLQRLLKCIQEAFVTTFDNANTYSSMLIRILAFYQENESIDIASLKAEEHDVEFFENYLMLFEDQLSTIGNIQAKLPIGFLLINSTHVKELVLTSTQKFRGIVSDMLIEKAYAEVNYLMDIFTNATFKLQSKPSDTLECVKYLTFLDEMKEEIQPLVAVCDVVNVMYLLIAEFDILLPPDYQAVYQILGPSMDTCRNTIDEALADRDNCLKKFCEFVLTNVNDLKKEVNEIRQEAMNPKIMDIESDKVKIKELLKSLITSADELKENSLRYQNYQIQFQVEVAHFEELEELLSELQLKQQLWSALDEWKDLVEKWSTAPFESLNHEELLKSTNKYLNICNTMNNVLPPNNIVPVLKEQVEVMKDKLPMINQLHNPALRGRHWEQIQKVLNLIVIPEEPFTLQTLTELDAFSRLEEVQEISGQASSEHSLEMILKKVEDSWKKTDFIILPFKDQEDVFILGGTDDVQQILDDSIINISTIASSRYVAPIKVRVDEWQGRLEIFSKTLDMWLQCQKMWLYLESIFTAPDINRQLPNEGKLFRHVDKSYKTIMRQVSARPRALRACLQPGLLETFQNNNVLLDSIHKCLETYLELKRLSFPRFYFLSNDELLEILSQTRDPLAVQPHLRKCFDAIHFLEFEGVDIFSKEAAESDSQPHIDSVKTILAMISPEGENVSLGKDLKTRGSVEDWLLKVEDAMFNSIRLLLKKSIADFAVLSYGVWLFSFSHQVILTISQIMWCLDIHSCLESDGDRLELMKAFEEKNFADLNRLAALVRGNLSKLGRATLCALITVSVNARDIVTEMVQRKVEDVTSFDWQKQLRYYWDVTQDTCIVHMSNSIYTYGYEYLGASPRLVITPLTNRCYLCLMGALQLDLGGAPAGPAGTGKTETTKDLAKSLAKHCVVFNCSDGIDYKMMGRFFSGLAQTGAWCCFDEFNRIDIEVLSVIAQQLITIRNAKVSRVSRFMFEGREIKLRRDCSTFITMNPGYAGRTELPDNLKALFRPISMMVPDYCLIAEVILYSEGFEASKMLAQKMTQMYKLCSEQLSQQDHYDFGMRALKSVLVMAGSLKQHNPDKSEDAVLIRALRDSNLPKFLKQDAVLFQAILQDLFPGIVIPEHDYGLLQTEIINVMESQNLQPVPALVRKIIQFYETVIVRHGVMLVGPTGGGKTTVYNVLATTLTNLVDSEVSDPFYKNVKCHVLNPKSIDMEELYGGINKLTLEWHDGLMAIIVRICVADIHEDHQWVICDGPVDALWIENLNTVLDDNKMLCLANSERIKLTPFIRMIFEVENLAVASPATVSRCGMVFVDPEEFHWSAYVKTWITQWESKMKTESRDFLLDLFDNYVDLGLKFVKKSCVQSINQVDIAKVTTLCKLLESLIFATEEKNVNFSLNATHLHPIICTTFMFCYVWAIGGNIIEANWDAFDNYSRTLFDKNPFAKTPNSGDLWSVYMDFASGRLESWKMIVPHFVYNKDIPFMEMFVPSVDTVRFGYLLEKLLDVGHSILYTGSTGVGKSVIANRILTSIAEAKNYVPIFMNFSAQTNSQRTQEQIESKLEKKKKNTFGAPQGKRLIFFIDDMNMPKLDTYGSQPPVELLRQYQDFHGIYQRVHFTWIKIKDVTLSAACCPPGGGRNPVTPRFIRHFSMFSIPSPDEYSLKLMFSAILNGFFAEFPQAVRQSVESIIGAAVEIYASMKTDLLPTPAKSHYLFNLRDLSKCVQGMLQANIRIVQSSNNVFRLFCHEAQRVFHDRLISDEDKIYFYTMLSDISFKHFHETLPPDDLKNTPIIFGDFMQVEVPTPDRVYKEITNMTKLQSVLNQYLEGFNLQSTREVKLVFFSDVLQHISRVVRMIRQEHGNALLVGVGGTGKQSVTRLAAFICGYQCFQIELRRGYDYTAFHDDLKKLYDIAGCRNENTVFLFTDTQIVMEEFLEDINNILNSGEVPNLLESEDVERLVTACRADAKLAGINEQSRDQILAYAINRIRNNLHIVLCMSPVGSSFRSRCRMFPSLVNCCIIDWFTEWPEEALLSVASFYLASVSMFTDQMKEKLGEMCVMVHISVFHTSETFYQTLKRRFYITPTSYLELITLYLSMLEAKNRELRQAHSRIQNGLNKIEQTNVLVEHMKLELVALEPELKQKSNDTMELLETLAIDQNSADEVREQVLKDEALAKSKAMETEAIAEDAQRDLDEALPALEGAIKALDSLDKSDIAEIRVFASPPELVMTVMEAVCILMHQKADWASAKGLLADPNFLKSLRDYDKNHIAESTLRKLKVYIDHPKFFPEIVENVSKACKSLCMWVRAIDLYARVFRTVEPKRERLSKAKGELEVVMSALRKQQKELSNVEAHIFKLKKIYNESVLEKERLERKITQTAVRLKRSTKLTAALADKYQRWCDIIIELNKQEGNVNGDVLVAAACVTYCGAFTNVYRQELIELWINHCHQLEIPISDKLSLVNVLSNPYEIQQWNTVGLPNDEVSIDNAIMVTKGFRWPLMIDPQEQANMWICRLEEENGLVIIKQSDKNFLRTLENCIRVGRPVLLEDIGETIEPSLEPLLAKQISVKSGRPLIRLGDTDIDYDRHFKFYMTTKLSNPHYMPEVCVKVTMVNFTVTKTGLEDQILGDVVRLEKPELEEKRNQLIIDINKDKTQLKSIEDRILQLLYETEGNILDKEELVNTLDEAKATSDIINQQLINTEQTEIKISFAREKYRPVAIRGSILYFVVADMALVDPMYQFSLKYFKQLLNMTIENSEQSNILEERLAILLKDITEFIYKNVSRGLFEKHKLLFSFLLCVEILKNEKKISGDEWNFFLRGAVRLDETYPPVPDVQGLTTHIWNSACDLSRCLSPFSTLKDDIPIHNIRVQLGSVVVDAIPTDLESSDEPKTTEESPQMSKNWNESLTSFQKLITIKAFEEEKTIIAITDFISENLGKTFIESPPVTLNTLYEDINKIIPLIFILSAGSDPMGALLKFASSKDYANRVQAISLGQGQGPIAESLIKTATMNGDWVFLQNCHLAQSWMPAMETLTRSLIDKPEKVHTDFRLYLSSMPATHFPISVLQNSVKVTNEPPKGLKANMQRAFANLLPSFFEDNILKKDWCKMVFGICFFHAIIQERKKFGSLGWNIKYDFAESDRECALLNLQMFCTSTIPWDALIYITGEITYGGRITDNWDQRCLRTVLKAFFHPDTLKSCYVYSPSEIYYAPDGNTLEEYKVYINELPLNEEPEIFGMHENVNIVFQKQETSTLVKTVLFIQPRISSDGGLMSNDDIVTELATSIQERLIDKLDIEQSHRTLFQLDDKGRVNSLTTVLSQEVDRFNKLLHVIKDSVYQLKQAIKGNVVMNLELEKMYQSFLDNQVPQIWVSVAYPSMKALGSWVQDLIARCIFLEMWIKKGQPESFWLPGFFFPQGFLTGTLQNHARKYNLPIDHLSFQYNVLPHYHQSRDSPQDSNEVTVNYSVTDGVIVYGLYMDGFCFDLVNMCVVDCLPGQMNPLLPLLHMVPEMDLETDDDDYTCPLYKTPMRAGTLSTTGHSTNFVVAVELPSEMSEDYWIARGSALLCELADI